jgi:hypothetical protein
MSKRLGAHRGRRAGRRSKYPELLHHRLNDQIWVLLAQVETSHAPVFHDAGLGNEQSSSAYGGNQRTFAASSSLSSRSRSSAEILRILKSVCYQDSDGHDSTFPYLFRHVSRPGRAPVNRMASNSRFGRSSCNALDALRAFVLQVS